MLETYFFDQGRVDAILLGCDGRWMFIDSGFRADGIECVKKLRRIGITKLHAYLASHLHKNHVGGAAPIIEAFKPDALYAGRNVAKTIFAKYAKSKKEKAAILDTPLKVLRPGDVIKFGGTSIICIGPEKIKNCSPGAYAENSNSLILRVQYGVRTMLLTGDTTGAILSGVDRACTGAIRVDLLKNPHHNGALTERVLKKIAPDITIICNGSPPSSSYTKRLVKNGSACYTACKKRDGDIRVRTDGSDWNVTTNI